MANTWANDRELFREVERLADLFEPQLCDAYAAMFSEVIASAIPGQSAVELVERYNQIRKVRTFAGGKVDQVFVLSRVTLGADIAVTSVVLDAAKKRFPDARIFFVGPTKNWELFDADPVLEHVPLAYGRSGSLADRLKAWPALREAVTAARSIVIDPDSRLTQLGLLPICADEDYYFFESRSYGGESGAALPQLTQKWVSEVFGVHDARAFIATLAATGDPADVTISLGVGENEAKRAADPFEGELLRYLVKRESSILIDRGGGGEEATRVERAVAQCGGAVHMWDGSFAGFAAQIARSTLYVGYDSAGGHAAAACGVPRVSIFGGQASERMLQRWRPWGPGLVRVIRAEGPGATLQKVMEALAG